ncbi:tudor domain-containing protein 5 isoform X2 [Nematostella vectensis]|uniref:tudor domain-containing protein 5 isoform X2 n=1 Tax=Nematostella vectensis TaxID=45351 RepID=UPI0020775BD7|nr:tudor domain-containing protein 5 isoform X2 [Nematostella vectensis]
MPESSSGDGKAEREKTKQQVSRHLRALLISAPNGLNVVEVQNDYFKFIGKHLPYRELGYKSALELLQALPDVVRPSWVRGELILRGIVDEASQRVASLIAKQRKAPKKSRATHVISVRPSLPPNVPYFTRSKIKELLSFYPSGLLGAMFPQAYERHCKHALDVKGIGFGSSQELLRSIPDIARIEQMKGGGYRVYAVQEKTHADQDKNINSSGMTCKVTSPPRPSKVTSPPRPSKVTSPPRPSRYSSASSDSSNSMLELDMIDNKKTELPNNKLEAAKFLIDSQNSVSRMLREEIAKILNMRPNGVWSARLPVEYKKLFKKELVVRQHGFTSVIELADAIPDIVRIHRPTKTGDWLLLGNKKGPYAPTQSDTIASTEMANEMPAVPGIGRAKPKPVISSVGPGRRHKLLVADGVGPGVFYSKLTVPETGYNDVYVTHATDPQDFWLMLFHNYPKLEALSEDIRVFYSSPEGIGYLMPDWFVSVGQVCCALYEEDGAWYRALITSFTSISNIEVFYVDYGNRSHVALHHLRVMKTSFLKLPAQAIHASLAYIKPAKGTEWSPGCCHRFYHITKDFKPLVGLFCGVKDETVSVCLCDTSQTEDIHINDELVEEGFALFNPPLSPPPVTQKLDVCVPNTKVTEPPGLSAHALDPFVINSTMKAPPGLHHPTLSPQPNSVCNKDSQSITNSNVSSTSFSAEVPFDNHMDSRQDLIDVSEEEMAFMDEICDELDQSTEDLCLLKRVTVLDVCAIHIINHDLKPYVTSADISALFWETDSLRAMLRQKRLSVPKLVVSHEENGPLLQELVRCNVRGSMEGDKPRTSVTLYAFQSLPEILNAFSHPSEDLMTRVLSEIELFEKEGDSYWIIKDDDETSTGTESESQDEGSAMEEELALEELKLFVQAMQFRRKRIIQSLMIPEGVGTGSTVDELLQVERKIEELKKQIKYREDQEATMDPTNAETINTKWNPSQTSSDQEMSSKCKPQPVSTLKQMPKELAPGVKNLMISSSIPGPLKGNTALNTGISNLPPAVEALLSTPAAELSIKPQVNLGNNCASAIIPSNCTANTVIPGNYTANDAIPSNNTTNDAIPGKYTANDVIPRNNTAYDVIPSNNNANEVIPSNNITNDVIPGNYAISNNNISSNFCIPNVTRSYGTDNNLSIASPTVGETEATHRYGTSVVKSSILHHQGASLTSREYKPMQSIVSTALVSRHTHYTSPAPVLLSERPYLQATVDQQYGRASPLLSTSPAYQPPPQQPHYVQQVGVATPPVPPSSFHSPLLAYPPTSTNVPTQVLVGIQGYGPPGIQANPTPQVPMYRGVNPAMVVYQQQAQGVRKHLPWN